MGNKFSKENCTYRRVLTKEDDGYFKCNDYWITGELQMSGKYRDLNFQTSRKENLCGIIKTVKQKQSEIT